MTTRLIRIALTLAAAFGLLGAAGCGCSYGATSDVTVTPGTTCLVVEQGTDCSSLAFYVANGCESPLVFSKNGNTLEVAPGEGKHVDPAVYGEVNEHDETCMGNAFVRGQLGLTEHLFEFTFELVNRGAGGC